MSGSQHEKNVQQHILYFVVKQIMLLAAFTIIMIFANAMADEKQESFQETSSMFGCIDGLTDIMDCIHTLFIFAFLVVPLFLVTSFVASFVVNVFMAGVDNSQNNKGIWDNIAHALMPSLAGLFIMLLFGPQLFSDDVKFGNVVVALLVYLVPGFFIDRFFYFQYLGKIRVCIFQLDKEIDVEILQQLTNAKKIIKHSDNTFEVHCFPKHNLRNLLFQFARTHSLRILSLKEEIRMVEEKAPNT